MAELNPTDTLLDRACDLLVQIAQLHLMTRREAPAGWPHHSCGICGTRWPCRTYRIATGDIE